MHYACRHVSLCMTCTRGLSALSNWVVLRARAVRQCRTVVQSHAWRTVIAKCTWHAHVLHSPMPYLQRHASRRCTPMQLCAWSDHVRQSPMPYCAWHSRVPPTRIQVCAKRARVFRMTIVHSAWHTRTHCIRMPNWPLMNVLHYNNEILLKNARMYTYDHSMFCRKWMHTPYDDDTLFMMLLHVLFPVCVTHLISYNTNGTLCLRVHVMRSTNMLERT